MGDIECGCRLVDATSPNFKALPNVIKSEKEGTTQTLQTLQTLLLVVHSVVQGEFVYISEQLSFNTGMIQPEATTVQIII